MKIKEKEKRKKESKRGAALNRLMRPSQTRSKEARRCLSKPTSAYCCHLEVGKPGRGTQNGVAVLHQKVHLHLDEQRLHLGHPSSPHRRRAAASEEEAKDGEEGMNAEEMETPA